MSSRIADYTNAKEYTDSQMNTSDIHQESSYSLDPRRPPIPTATNYKGQDQEQGKPVGDESVLATKAMPEVHANSSLSETSRDLSSTEVPLSAAFQKRKDEWAERGAAKLTKEYRDPTTGETKTEVVSKGIKDFKFGQEIGDGSYSTVVLATSIQDPSKMYAVKILNKAYLVRQKKVKYVNIEKTAWQRLNNSKCVVKMFFTFQDENSLYFLLEYAPNGDFLSLMKKYGTLSEDCTRYYSAQIIDALDFLHSKGIIHRDMKPENILLDENFKVKLTDFGTAKILEREKTEDTDEEGSYNLLTRSKSFVGTAEYVSPELLNDSYVDYKCDIWAYACIMYQMIAGKPPFKATNEYLTFQKVMKVQFAFTAGFPLVVRDLVKKILVRQPEKRLEIFDIKNHYFFKDLDFDEIWELDPPQIAPFKISAKSMAPIPALAKFNTLNTPRIQRNMSTPTLQTTNAHASMSARTSTPPTPTKKKHTVDPKTREILENAKKAVVSRKNQSQSATSLRKMGSSSASDVYNPKSAAVAAVAALSKTPSAKTKLKKKHAQQQPTIDHPGMMVSKSTSSVPSYASSVHDSDSSVSTVKTRKVKRIVKKTPPSSSGASVLKNASFTEDESAQMKEDPWGAYMRPNESVIKVDEIDVVKLPTQSLEKIMTRKSLSLKEIPSISDELCETAEGKSSFLSKVARSGVTGFRNLDEHDLYSMEKFTKSFEPAPEYSLHPFDPAVFETDHNPLKKIFNTSLAEQEELHDKTVLVSKEYYEKKLMIITSLGRCLLFIKSKTGVYHLQHRIYLNQSSVQLNEISSSSNDLVDNYQFVLKTPFQSFAFQCPIVQSVSWITCLRESMHVAAKASKKQSSMAESPSSSSETSSASSSLSGSDKLEGRPVSMTKSPSMNSISHQPKPSPSRSFNKKKPSSSVRMDQNQSARGERIFDSYVSMRQRKHDSARGGAKPVQSSIKLINGLPLSIRPSPPVTQHVADGQRQENESSHDRDLRREIQNAAELATHAQENNNVPSTLDRMRSKFSLRHK